MHPRAQKRTRTSPPKCRNTRVCTHTAGAQAHAAARVCLYLRAYPRLGGPQWRAWPAGHGPSGCASAPTPGAGSSGPVCSSALIGRCDAKEEVRRGWRCKDIGMEVSVRGVWSERDLWGGQIVQRLPLIDTRKDLGWIAAGARGSWGGRDLLRGQRICVTDDKVDLQVCVAGNHISTTVQAVKSRWQVESLQGRLPATHILTEIHTRTGTHTYLCSHTCRHTYALHSHWRTLPDITTITKPVDFHGLDKARGFLLLDTMTKAVDKMARVWMWA